MLVWSTEANQFVIDPHFLTIIPLRKIWDADKSKDKPVANAKLLWMYHRYNPHSPFNQHRNSDKSRAIVEATFPKAFLQEKEKGLIRLIAEANAKNREMDELYNKTVAEEVTVEKQKQVVKPEHAFVPTLKLYDPEEEEDMEDAIKWYLKYLKQTPLWAAVESYKEAIYNLSDAIKKKTSTPNEIKIASIELDQLPARMERMRQQAIKDEAQTLKVSGDKNIKKRERTVATTRKLIEH